jgi:dTDP-4-dehydrorhamnose 3,5-epimerase
MEKIKLNPAFKDDRGSIWDLLTNDQVNHVGLLKSKKNSIRGKHYHKLQKQHTLIFKGKVKIITKDLTVPNSPIEEFILESMEMIVFPPFCYHSIETIDDSVCLIFTDRTRIGNGYEEDTIRINDIENYSLSD